MPVCRLLVCVCLLLLGCQRAETEGNDVHTSPTALRIVTLAPHLAELVVSAGAESLLVGVSAYTDFPQRLSALPVVSDGFRVDAEALMAAQPTVVLAWGGGGQSASRSLVQELGFSLTVIETRTTDDVAQALRRIGALAGTQKIAEAAAANFEQRIDALGYSGDRLSVFYQISESPLYTVGGGHYISELLARCGGRNIFEPLTTLAPVVSLEAVVAANPDVILSGDANAAFWQRFPAMTVNRAGTTQSIPADVVARPSTRLAEGGEAICRVLAQSRSMIAAMD